MVRKHKSHKVKIELPYKQTYSGQPIAEDIEKATQRFSHGDKNTSTGKYEMILVAANRARDLSRGAESQVGGNYKSVVRSLLEIEAGYVGREYVSETVAKRS